MIRNSFSVFAAMLLAAGLVLAGEQSPATATSQPAAAADAAVKGVGQLVGLLEGLGKVLSQGAPASGFSQEQAANPSAEAVTNPSAEAAANPSTESAAGTANAVGKNRDWTRTASVVAAAAGVGAGVGAMVKKGEKAVMVGAIAGGVVGLIVDQILQNRPQPDEAAKAGQTGKSSDAPKPNDAPKPSDAPKPEATAKPAESQPAVAPSSIPGNKLAR